jgi:hypothetical protein
MTALTLVTVSMRFFPSRSRPKRRIRSNPSPVAQVRSCEGGLGCGDDIAAVLGRHGVDVGKARPRRLNGEMLRR